MVLGTLSVEAIYQDRDQFAQLVREVAAPDVGRMGIEILSFTIKDVYDSVEYLESLGRAQTANVKRDADIGVAEANRDAGIRVRGMKILSYLSFSVLVLIPLHTTVSGMNLKHIGCNIASGLQCDILHYYTLINILTVRLIDYMVSPWLMLTHEIRYLHCKPC